MGINQAVLARRRKMKCLLENISKLPFVTRQLKGEVLVPLEAPLERELRASSN
jgi:hypothetical protein